MRTLTAMLLAFVLAFAFSAASCQDSNKVEQAVYDTSVGLNATAKSLGAFHDQGVINDEDYQALVRIQLDVARAHKEVVNQVKLAGSITPQNKQAILVFVDQLAASLEKLQKQGVLRLKSQEAQTSFAAGIAVARTALVTISTYIGAIKKPTPITLKGT